MQCVLATKKGIFPPTSHREAVAELRRNAGTQFDPHLLEKFVKMLKALFPELEPTATPTV